MNKILFENATRKVDGFCLRIFMAINEVPIYADGDKFTYILNLIYFGHNPIGFFDGADTGFSSGVGIMLKLSNSHFFKANLAIGTDTNIKAELVGLWGLLFFSLKFQILDLMVVGDSKVVLDWFVGISSLNVLSLQCWKRKTLELKAAFNSIQCFHIHRSFNTVADNLSKFVLDK
jgi:ribonuclease HI